MVLVVEQFPVVEAERRAALVGVEVESEEVPAVVEAAPNALAETLAVPRRSEEAEEKIFRRMSQ